MYFDRITDFIFRSEKPEKADMIFIPGSGYGELAQKAAQLYKRYCQEETGREIICLPSTSPANCRVHYEELYEAYKVIRDYILGGLCGDKDEA